MIGYNKKHIGLRSVAGTGDYATPVLVTSSGVRTQIVPNVLVLMFHMCIICFIFCYSKWVVYITSDRLCAVFL